MKPFYTWKANGIQFLAVWNGEGYHITDEMGQNFGAWQDMEAFRALQAKHHVDGFLGLRGTWCIPGFKVTATNPGFETPQIPCAVSRETIRQSFEVC